MAAGDYSIGDVWKAAAFRPPATTVAEAYLALLRARGIDHLFANAGSDFAPLIEAYARAPKAGLDFPEPVLVPHENAAVAMAHGHYLASGRPQAVMVHVSVGLANGLCALLNAARENIPIFFTAGRTPITETGDRGSRDIFVHWGQEMFDQAGMLREMVKWDYELRTPDQLECVVDRALALALSAPAGPVYLGLPREVLGAPIADVAFSLPSRHAPSRPPRPDPDAVEEAARLLAVAERPVIVTTRAGRDPQAMRALAAFAEEAAIPVVSDLHAPYLNLPTGHPMHVGYDPGEALDGADAILVIDTPVPWLPVRHRPRRTVPVIHLGEDPQFARLPIRGFPVDIGITARVADGIAALASDFTSAARGREQEIACRRRCLAYRHREADAARRTTLLDDGRLTPARVSHCLSQIKGEESVVVNEIGCVPPAMRFERPGSYFGLGGAAGLGWGLPAALGIKLARPEAEVIACVGDGSYMLANPVACHQAAAAHNLPALTVVFNNHMWKAVKSATASLYPDGHALAADPVPLTALEPSPHFQTVIQSCGGYGEQVSDPAALPAALERALARVRDGQQALLNVLCTQ